VIWQVLGAEKSFVQRVFIQQGLMIALSGALIGSSWELVCVGYRKNLVM